MATATQVHEPPYMILLLTMVMLTTTRAFLIQPRCYAAATRFLSPTTSRCMTSSAPTIFHFNHAGSSPSPTSVIERVVEHMYLEKRLGGYAAHDAVGEELQQVYELTVKLLNAKSASEIALVESATVAWTRLFYAMMEYHERSKNGEERVILVSEAEYAAQVVAMNKWVEEHKGWRILVLPSAVKEDGTSTGMVDINILEDMLQGSYESLDPSDIVLVCVTHIPTNSGIANPVVDIGKLLAKHNMSDDAFYLVDACQSVGQMQLDVQEIGCHGLCGTGRKYLRAPRGTGFMYVRNDTASRLLPSHIDHECAPVVSVPSDYPDSNTGRVDYRFLDGAKRFEFWESSAASKLGFGEAVRYALEDSNGIPWIQERIRKRSLELQSQMESIGRVAMYYPGSTSGIVTFTTDMEPNHVKEQLWHPDSTGNAFEVSVVPATSTPFDSARTGSSDLLRASVSYMTTSEDITLFCKRLSEIL